MLGACTDADWGASFALAAAGLVLAAAESVVCLASVLAFFASIFTLLTLSSTATAASASTSVAEEELRFFLPRHASFGTTQSGQLQSPSGMACVGERVKENVSLREAPKTWTLLCCSRVERVVCM